MQGNLTIVGVKQFKGEVEGISFDHTKLLVMLPFPRARAETNSGFDVVEAPFGTHENFKLFSGRKFPLVVDADYEITTKGIEIFEAKFAQQQQKPNV